MSERLKRSLLCALANALVVFLVRILVNENEYEKWTSLLLLSAAIFVITFLIDFLIPQKNDSKGQ